MNGYLCPLKTQDNGKCDKEHCAWWLPDFEGCSIPFAALTLDQINDQLSKSGGSA